MSIVQAVTSPRNWIRTSPTTLETNRHVIVGSRNTSGALQYSAARKPHPLLTGDLSLGCFAAAADARSACEADYWKLPQYPPVVGEPHLSRFDKPLTERHAERVWRKDKAEFERRMKSAERARERKENVMAGKRAKRSSRRRAV